MKKLLYLLPLLLGIIACGAQPQPTQGVAEIVNATLTAIVQDYLQVIPSQPAITPAPIQVQPTAIRSEPASTDVPVSNGSMTYFWPSNLPAGFALNRENSRAGADGFVLTFMDSSQGIDLRLAGGAEADKYKYCINLENSPSEPVMVRGQEGCYPPSTGGGFGVEWKENGIHYSVGGMSVSREFALATAEQLETVDLTTFLTRLGP